MAGDDTVAGRLAVQLRDLLRDRTMTFDQLASCYSIKHGSSLSQKLKEIARAGAAPAALGDFLAGMPNFFEFPEGFSNKVRARKASEAPGGVALSSGASSASGYPPSSVVSAAAAGVSPSPVAAPALPVPKDNRAAPSPPAENGDRLMKYADVSRGAQSILREFPGPITVVRLEELFHKKFATSISDVVGMATGEYLQRKANIFAYSPDRGTVWLHGASSATSSFACDAGVVSTSPAVSSSAPAPVSSQTSSRLCAAVPPPTGGNAAEKMDEAFVVREFAALVEDLGPIVYISTLCGKFIQRNGVSVSSVVSTRPLDLFKRHPGIFLIVGAGNVTLKKYEHLPEVQAHLDKPSSKAHRILKAAEEAQLPVPEVVTEQHVVEEFRRLILSDQKESVYISSLCGRFLQRFKQPVTAIINCKPADFLRRYPDIFVMVGGGNVGLREILGPDAVSVPPPPQRLPKARRDADDAYSREQMESIQMTDEVYQELVGRLCRGYHATLQRLQGLCRRIESDSFLALEEVVLGGAVGKGLLTDNGAQAEIVLFVRQLPRRGFSQWLPHILETLAPVLEAQLASAYQAERFKVEKDRLRFHLPAADPESGRDLLVHVYVTPVFKSRAELFECLEATPPTDRFYLYPAMVKERNDFIGKVPHKAKALIRLTTRWASQQTWPLSIATPSDWLLELLVVHTLFTDDGLRALTSSAGERGGGSMEGLSLGFNAVVAKLAAFHEVKVTWEDTWAGLALYQPQDIWKPLLAHEPLFMDPLNPYCNLADATCFDSRELVSAARHEDHLLCMRRDVARQVLGEPAPPAWADAQEGDG